MPDGPDVSYRPHWPHGFEVGAIVHVPRRTPRRPLPRIPLVVGFVALGCAVLAFAEFQSSRGMIGPAIIFSGAATICLAISLIAFLVGTLLYGRLPGIVARPLQWLLAAATPAPVRPLQPPRHAGATEDHRAILLMRPNDLSELAEALRDRLGVDRVRMGQDVCGRPSAAMRISEDGAVWAVLVAMQVGTEQVGKAYGRLGEAPPRHGNGEVWYVVVMRCAAKSSHALAPSAALCAAAFNDVITGYVASRGKACGFANNAALGALDAGDPLAGDVAPTPTGGRAS